MRNKLFNLAETGIMLPAQMALGYLALMCLFFHTYIQFGDYALYSYEFAVISKNSIVRILCIAFGFLAFACLKPSLKSITPQRLFLNFLSVYCFCAVFLIFQSSGLLKDDAYLILQSAKEISQGEYRAFSPENFAFYYVDNRGGYLFFNPHQLGLVFLEQLLVKISENSRFFFFLNFLILIMTNYMVFKVVDLMTDHNRVSCNYAIVLSFLFYPQLFFVLFVYGLLACNLLIISAYYYFIKFIKHGRNRDLVYHLLLIAFAVFIKSNAMIALIAFCILFVMEFIKSNKKVMLLAPVLAVALSFSSTALLKQYYEHKIDREITGGMPMSSYLMMGISNKMKTGRLGGWWNSYNMDVYLNNSFDREKAIAVTKKDIAKRLDEMVKNPWDTGKFFVQKVASTWTDPMFQSIWSGPMHKSAYDNSYNPIIEDLSRAGNVYKLIDAIANILVFIIYMSLFMFLYKNKKVDILWLFPYLYFLGGFLFHFAWETKSQYAFTYVFMLIPVCAHFLSGIDVRGKIKSISSRFTFVKK